eukprot:GHVS01078382.1.p1 GENE.GHVS01078382.1~~GHVS01078382.1.p1  ORF type:complete len:556 (-),score=38.22 GHVS01078382.1:1360-3027(-)
MTSTLMGSLANRFHSVAASNVAVATGTMGRNSTVLRNAKSRHEAMSLTCRSFSEFFPGSGVNMHALRDMRDTGQILKAMATSFDTSAPTLDTALRSLSRVRMSRDECQALFTDERFIGLMSKIRDRLPDMDSRFLSMIASSLVMFPSMSNDISDISQKISDIAVRRENSFSPRALAALVNALPKLGVRSPVVGEFFRLETQKILPDCTPMDLHKLVEGFRLFGCLNRELSDSLIEKMSDEIDRYTSKDVCETLAVLANAGLSRGFLIRRLSSLAFENLNQFSAIRLVSLLDSLSRLRFLTADNYADVLDLLKQNVHDLYGPHVAKLTYALCLGNCVEQVSFVKQMIEQAQNNGLPLGLESAVRVAYCILYFKLPEFDDYLKELLATAFQQDIEKHRFEARWLLLDIIASLECERPDLGIVVPPSFTSTIQEKDREYRVRLEGSRVYTELVSLVENLGGKYRLNLQRDTKVGPYTVVLMDEETKIIIEQDNVTYKTNGLMKMRILEKLGNRPVLIPYWQWRRCRSETDQMMLLRHALDFHLNALGRSEVDEKAVTA